MGYVHLAIKYILMKQFFSFIFLLAFISCHNSNVQDNINDIRKDFNKEARKSKEQMLGNIELTDSLYTLAIVNMDTAINAVDKYISANTKNPDLYNIKGDIYFKYKKYNEAKVQYSNAIRLCSSCPKYLNSRAETYIKLQKLDSALADLKESTNINHDGNWLIGNFYEIKKQVDSAKHYYSILYLSDTTVYKYCKDRIVALDTLKTPNLFKELDFKDLSETEYIILNSTH
jgi:tetratricopeptide (TPR) repeat protein